MFRAPVEVSTFVVEAIPAWFSDSPLVDPPSNPSQLGAPIMLDGINEVDRERPLVLDGNLGGFQSFEGHQFDGLLVYPDTERGVHDELGADQLPQFLDAQQM